MDIPHLIASSPSPLGKGIDQRVHSHRNRNRKMPNRHSLLSAVVASFAIAAIPSASPFSAPSLNDIYYSHRHLDAVHPHRHHGDFSASIARHKSPRRRIVSWYASSLDSGDDETDINTPIESASERIERCKRELIQQCNDHESGSGKKSSSIENKIMDLEQIGEELGFGLESSLSGLLSGEWELIYSSDDITRSSPFFWAFRRAFPDSSDQIFGITDAIPPPIKEVGPAIQTIDVDFDSRPITGTLVSRVKVATLGGLATSIMTTRCSILCEEGVDGLRLKVKSTKPEDSTILKKLGPLGEFVNSSSPPFPSGEALESVVSGSSEVVMQTTYCDAGLRISRNADRSQEDVFVWKRVKFGSGSTVSL